MSIWFFLSIIFFLFSVTAGVVPTPKPDSDETTANPDIENYSDETTVEKVSTEYLDTTTSEELDYTTITEESDETTTTEEENEETTTSEEMEEPLETTESDNEEWTIDEDLRNIEDMYPIKNHQGITKGNFILSHFNLCRFVMQPEGNAVLLKNNKTFFDTKTRWQSSNSEKTYPMAVYDDGALKVISRTHELYKWQMIEPKYAPGSELFINDNCAFRIIDSKDQYIFDSNMLFPKQILDAGQKIWSTYGGYVCKLLSDCRFAIYPMNGKVRDGKVYGRAREGDVCQLKNVGDSRLLIWSKHNKVVRTVITFSSKDYDPGFFPCPDDGQANILSVNGYYSYSG